jgi:hypothetical protein
VKEPVRVTSMKCLRCQTTLPLGQIYCLAHRPDNFEMILPGGKRILWCEHPNYRKVKEAMEAARAQGAQPQAPAHEP